MGFTDDGRPVWTDEERAEIAAEHDGLAERLFAQAVQSKAVGREEEARRTLLRAWETKDVADAARHSTAALARLY